MALLRHVLSTLQSPALLRVIVVYQESDFYGIQIWGSSNWPHLCQVSEEQKAEEASRHRLRFKLLREACKVKNFELVLRADVWGPVGEYAVRRLEEAVAAEKAKKGFDNFSSEPLVIYDPHRGLRPVAAPQPSS